MSNKYEKVNAQFSIPEGAELETVLRTLGTQYKIERVSPAIEDLPTMFLIEEINNKPE